MLIQSFHPSKSSPRPTVSVVASEILRHWPLIPDGQPCTLIDNGPDYRIPWQVFTPDTPKGLDIRPGQFRCASVSYPNAEPSRHRAKRMAVQLLKALK